MKAAPLTGLVLLILAGCGNPEKGAATTVVNSEGQTESAGFTQPISETVSLKDPVEASFTVNVPKGWFNKAYSVRIYDVYRQVVTCVSPNSDTVIFFGDPNIPQYWNPQTANEMTHMMAKVSPVQKIESYKTASTYFEEYAKRKFGKLEDFKIDRIDSKTEATNRMTAKFRDRGIQFSEAEIVELFFTYTSKGKKMSGMLNGSTVDFGPFWTALVGGISTEGNAEDYKSMMESMGNSLVTLPEWTAKQQAKHEQVMEQIRLATERQARQHAANMQWIQDSAQRHQQRMQAIWAQGDASMKAYYARSASSDLQHQNFLNYINEESTVVNSSGQAFQVDNKYDRYYINKNDPNKYVGGDIRLDHDKLGSLGVNPDDYEEVKIRRASGN